MLSLSSNSEYDGPATDPLTINHFKVPDATITVPDIPVRWLMRL